MLSVFFFFYLIELTTSNDVQPIGLSISNNSPSSKLNAIRKLLNQLQENIIQELQHPQEYDTNRIS
jgi:hypothetical protein